MTPEFFVVDGTRWVTVETVARCYTVQVEWVQQVVELGLVGRCEEREGSVTMPAAQLERVAKIVQLHFYQGLELSVVSVLLR